MMKELVLYALTFTLTQYVEVNTLGIPWFDLMLVTAGYLSNRELPIHGPVCDGPRSGGVAG